MIEFYPEIWIVHVTAVSISGLVFLARGLLDFAGVRRAEQPLRYLAYASDTVLLTAALMLMTVLQQYPFVHGWLTVKVVLLAIYLGLGTYAFGAAASRPPRLAAWIAALAVYGFIISVARAKDPWGVLGRLVGYS